MKTALRVLASTQLRVAAAIGGACLLIYSAAEGFVFSALCGLLAVVISVASLILLEDDR